MTTQSIPSENDIQAVEERLATLYAELSPAQQEILETIIAAGLTLTSTDDTAGYSMLSSYEMEHLARSRMAELREDFRRANFQQEETGASDEAGPRWNLGPLLEWFRRAPAAQQRPGGAAV